MEVTRNGHSRIKNVYKIFGDVIAVNDFSLIFDK